MTLDTIPLDMDSMLHRDAAVDSVKQGLKVPLGHFIFGYAHGYVFPFVVWLLTFDIRRSRFVQSQRRPMKNPTPIRKPIVSRIKLIVSFMGWT